MAELLPGFGIVHSSHGDFVIDENGIVTKFKAEESASQSDAEAEADYHNYVRFDLPEYKKHYGELDTEYDILDLGFWKKDGSYEPPEKDFRDRVARIGTILAIAVTNVHGNVGPGPVYNSEPFLTKHKINDYDGEANKQPQEVAEQVRIELGGRIPDQILLIGNEKDRRCRPVVAVRCIAHWMDGKDYNLS
jgi:hypothetical protein